MTINNFLKIIFSILPIISTAAHAVIIEGHFIGKVRAFENGTADGLFTGYWDNVAIGSQVSGSFWYDTAKAPANSSTDSYYTYHHSYTDEWMGSNFTIDGKTYYISDHVPLDRYVIKTEGVNLFDLDTPPDNSYTAKEIFYLYDNISSGGTQGGYKAVGLAIEVSKEDKTLLNGLSLIQEFDWYDLGDPTSSAWAYIDIGSSLPEEMRASNAWIDISELRVRIKNSAFVSEPPPLFLLFTVLFFLKLIRRRSFR